MQLPAYGVILAVLVASPLAAASPKDTLEAFFEGKQVVVLIDMPATTKGVDLHPGAREPLDRSEHEKRLGREGVGLRQGDRAVVTEVKVKKKHIEFQLGAGGNNPKPSYSPPHAPKGKLEYELEKQRKDAKTDAEKEQIKKRLAYLYDQRMREDRQLEAIYKIEYEQMVSQHTDEEWALMAGSRFNIRFDKNVPASVLAPEGLMQALNGYVDFSPPPAPPQSATSERAEPALAADPLSLRKGLSELEVKQLLGPPESCVEEAGSDFTVNKCLYVLTEEQVEARFVDGVLVRYTLSSR